MKKSIKELLSIDLKSLLDNSSFLRDGITDEKDSRKFLIYDLESKFLNIYDQLEIRIFDGHPMHIQFRTKMNDSQQMKTVIERITKEYGPDQNNLISKDWDSKKHFAWWFKNEKHELTADDAFEKNPDSIYYGLMITPGPLGGSELLICNYMVLENKDEKQNFQNTQ